MRLTDRHIDVIKEYISTSLMGEAWAKYFSTGNKSTDKVQACNFFKRPEVKAMLKLLQEARDKAIVEATQKTYEKMYAEEIATELELDILHTKIIRGQTEMEEIFPVREKKLVPVPGVDKNTVKWVLEETVVFKRVKRPASIKERQISAGELYKRKGSYKGVTKVQIEQDDQEAAERSKLGNGNEPLQRMVILSDGTKLPI